MAYKVKRYVPFSNGTEAEIWMDRNCYLCKRTHCYAKLTIEQGFIFGDIPLKRAEWIGKDDGFGLVDKCTKFTTHREVKPKQKDNIDKFQYKMF